MSANPLRNATAWPTEALPRDDEAFGDLIERHRRDTVLLCYRFLGSLPDAEEAAQETALRAWRGRSAFRGDASVRTWLHRIATRVCLDTLDQRRRLLPTAVGSPADPTRPPESPSEVTWLGPLPDAYLADLSAEPVDPAHDPAVRYSLRESVSLAFLAALQTLPARQRAVLILRDVLGWTAPEVATALETTEGSVNSLLHRARTAMRASHHAGGIEAMPSREPDDPALRRLLEAYMRAWEADDIDALVATLKEDVRLAMPPSPSWYLGRAAVAELLRRWVFGAGAAGRFRLELVGANGGPAIALLESGSDGRLGFIGVQVLDLEPDGIASVTVFMDRALGGAFGHPAS